RSRQLGCGAVSDLGCGTVSDRATAARRRGLTASAVTSPSGACSVSTSRPVSASHTLTTPSAPPLNRRRPSRPKATPPTRPAVAAGGVEAAARAGVMHRHLAALVPDGDEATVALLGPRGEGQGGHDGAVLVQ